MATWSEQEITTWVFALSEWLQAHLGQLNRPVDGSRLKAKWQSIADTVNARHHAVDPQRFPTKFTGVQAFELEQTVEKLYRDENDRRKKLRSSFRRRLKAVSKQTLPLTKHMSFLDFGNRIAWPLNQLYFDKVKKGDPSDWVEQEPGGLHYGMIRRSRLPGMTSSDESDGSHQPMVSRQKRRRGGLTRSPEPEADEVNLFTKPC